MTFTILIFMCLLGFSSQRSTPQDTSYVAAVVEFEMQSDTDVNLAKYVDLIKDAASQNADIIVFPELTLSNHANIIVPIGGLLLEHPIPALAPQLFDKIMVNISSAARDNEIYVVINAQEIVNCTVEAVGENCPENKTYYFNTNVVFDRQGAVIDRYRKINLFGEFTRTPALSPDLGVFTTDFGVTFGHYICFDLMFQVPAVQVVEKNNLTDIVFTTMWFSEMPYLTAVQIQEAYAHTMNVNFLAAGANNVRVGSAGSGIYSGKAGALVSIMPGAPTTRLLVSRVPKVPGQVEGSYPGPIYDDPTVQDNLILISDPSLPSHVTRILRPGFQQFILFDRDTVCRFSVNLAERNSEKHYVYRAAAFSGVRSFSGVSTGGMRACSVFACRDNTIESCGQRWPQFVSNATAVFEELIITATVPPRRLNSELSANNSAYFAVSLDTSIMPLKPEQFDFNHLTLFNIIDIYTHRLVGSNSDLYSFGIWGREFTTDDEEASAPREHDDGTSGGDGIEVTPSPDTENTPGSSVVHHLSIILLIFSALAFLF